MWGKWERARHPALRSQKSDYVTVSHTVSMLAERDLAVHNPTQKVTQLYFSLALENLKYI